MRKVFLSLACVAVVVVALGFLGVGCAAPSYVAGKRVAPSVVVLVHGLKDYSDRYNDFASALVKRGYAVYALDLHGHGDSEGDRVWVERFGDYLDDVDLHP